MNATSKYIVANKVWLLRQVKLPHDIVEEICGYIFHDQYAASIREKKQNTISAFKTHLVNGAANNGHWWFWAGQHEMQFQANNCPRCGNYIFTNNDEVATNILCSCQETYYNNNDHTNTNTNEDETGPTIEDIENEDEEYRDYREARREIILGW